MEQQTDVSLFQINFKKTQQANLKFLSVAKAKQFEPQSKQPHTGL